MEEKSWWINLTLKMKKILWNKEVFWYAFFGFTTMIVGIAIYQGFVYCGMDYKLANLFSLVLGKLYAYIMNKFFVFKVRSKNFVEWMKEFFRFFITRGATGLIDYFGVIILVEVFSVGEIISKYILQVIVIILNYILGKKIVFKK